MTSERQVRTLLVAACFLCVLCLYTDGKERTCVDRNEKQCERLASECGRSASVRQRVCRRTCGTCPVPYTKLPFVPCSSRNPSLSTGTLGQFASDSAAFARRLYDAESRRRGAGNLLFSPASVEMALAMTYAGARGSTREQMHALLAPSLQDEQVLDAYSWMMNELISDNKKYKLFTANTIYFDNNLDLLKQFSQTTNKCFDTKTHKVNFDGNTNRIRTEINFWVATSTKYKIRQLIPSGVLNAQTMMVLVNALYFKAAWLKQFNNDGETITGEFYPLSSPNRPVAQKMMKRKTQFLYNSMDGFQMLGLPYEDNELAMFIFLPNERDGLTEMEDGLSSETMMQLMDGAEQQTVSVTIPKFKLTHTFPLKRALISVGMGEIFSQSADFSGIDERAALFVSDALHKAFVEVNEKGTEAAAATAVVMAEKAVIAAGRTKQFNADHAFLFVIRHAATGQLLFMGRFVQP